MRKSLVAVHIDPLAYGGRCDLPVKRGIHPYAAESVLVKHPAGRIAADSTVNSLLDAVWVLENVITLLTPVQQAV